MWKLCFNFHNHHQRAIFTITGKPCSFSFPLHNAALPLHSDTWEAQAVVDNETCVKSHQNKQNKTISKETGGKVCVSLNAVKSKACLIQSCCPAENTFKNTQKYKSLDSWSCTWSHLEAITPLEQLRIRFISCTYFPILFFHTARGGCDAHSVCP